MFGRLRMSSVVEMQGSDWDWLRLIAASGTCGRGQEKNSECRRRGLLPAYSSGP